MTEKVMKNKSQMIDDITTFFGNSGLDVQIGNTVIKGKKSNTTQSVMSKCGTVLTPGMCVRHRRANDDRSWSEPCIIIGLYSSECPRLDVVRVDDPERHIVWWLAHPIWGEDYGKGGWHDFYQEYEVLDQADVDKWWTDTHTHTSGWHEFQGNRHFRVHFDATGVPDIIQREYDWQSIEEVRVMAEIVTGYDLTIERRYLDDDKLQRRVKTTVRRSPPKI